MNDNFQCSASWADHINALKPSVLLLLQLTFFSMKSIILPPAADFSRLSDPVIYLTPNNILLKDVTTKNEISKTWNSTVCLSACLNHVSSFISFFIKAIKVNQRTPFLLTRLVWMSSHLIFHLFWYQRHCWPRLLKYLFQVIKMPTYLKMYMWWKPSQVNIKHREKGGERKRGERKKPEIDLQIRSEWFLLKIKIYLLLFEGAKWKGIVPFLLCNNHSNRTWRYLKWICHPLAPY